MVPAGPLAMTTTQHDDHPTERVERVERYEQVRERPMTPAPAASVSWADVARDVARMPRDREQETPAHEVESGDRGAPVPADRDETLLFRRLDPRVIRAVARGPDHGSRLRGAAIGESHFVPAGVDRTRREPKRMLRGGAVEIGVEIPTGA